MNQLQLGVGFDPVVDGRTFTFEAFGLRQDVFVMVDRQTGSIWTHFEGTAIEGPMTGASLTMPPMPQMTWWDSQQSTPETFVLSDDTGYSSWYTPVQIAQSDRGEDLYGDNRLPSHSLVFGVGENGAYLGYPIDVLQVTGGVVKDLLGEEPLVVF